MGLISETSSYYVDRDVKKYKQIIEEYIVSNEVNEVYNLFSSINYSSWHDRIILHTIEEILEPHKSKFEMQVWEDFIDNVKYRERIDYNKY